MSDTKNNLPAMPFYTGDWLKCLEVRTLPLDCRALWLDMLCYMWESTERGVLLSPKGRPYSNEEIIRMVGLDNQNSAEWLTRIINDGVCSRRSDGAIYSRRMVKDEKIRRLRKEVGAKGGNPKLLVNTEVNHNLKQTSENENENENEVDNNIINNKVEKNKFIPPTVEEVKTYIDSKNITCVDPMKFVAYYETTNWTRGKTKIKNWKACIYTWIKNNE